MRRPSSEGTRRDNEKGGLPWLPFDLQEEILLLVTAESLIRFKTVCTHWLNLITSKRFLRSYHFTWRYRYGEPYGLDGGESYRWQPAEDRTLRAFVCLYGDRHWLWASSESGLLRGSRSCRVWWRKYLSPGLVRSRPKSNEEEV